jgi:hypothetical protein
MGREKGHGFNRAKDPGPLPKGEGASLLDSFPLQGERVDALCGRVRE